MNTSRQGFLNGATALGIFTVDARVMGFIVFACVMAGVASGTSSDVKAAKISERFGFDPIDSSRFVQAALDSDIPEIIIDKQAGDWHVTPLKGRSNKTIVFEDGAYLVAKKGAYKGHDKLFSFVKCTNVVIRGIDPDRCGIRMYRDDYKDQSTYMKSEWRHAISLLSCEHFSLEGIEIAESGGDGLYIGRRGTPCRDITVRNCRFDRNYRQGISVISARNLLVEDSIIANTAGTPPAAGIDFEPNGSDEILEHIVLRNCIITNNYGKGVYFELERYHDATPKVSARLINCRMSDNESAFTINQGKHLLDRPVEDFDICFKGCTFERSRGYGLYISRRPLSSGIVHFEDCVVSSNCLERPNAPDMVLSAFPHYGFPIDGYVFRNMTVVQPRQRSFLMCPIFAPRSEGAPCTSLDGTIRVLSPGFETNVVYRAVDPGTCAAKPVKLLPQGEVSLDGAEVVDTAPGKSVPCQAVLVCGRSYISRPYYVFYADTPKTVHFNYVRNKGKNLKGRIQLCKYDPKIRKPVLGAVLETRKLDHEDVEGELTFTVPKKGFYMLMVCTMMKGFGITGTDVPMALNVSYDIQTMTGSNGSMLPHDHVGRVFFLAGQSPVSANVIGDGSGHYIGCEIRDPSGRIVFDAPAFSGARHFRIDAPAAGMWSLAVKCPRDGWYEQYSLGLTGVSGWYFLCKEKYWIVKQPQNKSMEVL